MQRQRRRAEHEYQHLAGIGAEVVRTCFDLAGASAKWREHPSPAATETERSSPTTSLQANAPTS